MSEIFGSSYAANYDLFYAEKDYEGEVDTLGEILSKHGRSETGSVLDLGCGTGGHAVPLAKRGHEVVGVDRSPSMLQVARDKARAANVAVEFRDGDIRDIEVGRRFDAVLAMFAVVGYQTTNRDVERVFQTARSHLDAGGLFLFDVWFGPAVLVQGPSDRFRILESDEGTHLRAASTTLDLDSQTCDVTISTWQIEEGRVVGQSQEDHTMRFFFPQEVALFAQATGFEVVDLLPFPSGTGDPDVTTWNVLAALRAT
ncbi:MAG: class I SAM-dependent methyltransferase [Actinomycetota bacterium]|nr:class I SAM-dependent methyltransferase [Actinomycetota bacterium]